MFRSFEVNFKEREIIGHVDDETKYIFVGIPLTVMSRAAKATNLDAFYNDFLSDYTHLVRRTGEAREKYKQAKGVVL